MEDSGKTERADSSPEAVLELREVSKQFVAGKRTVQALRNVSLAVRPGRVTGLIGPDGAGKTTLMRLAVGLLAPDEGEIRTLGFRRHARVAGGAGPRRLHAAAVRPLRGPLRAGEPRPLRRSAGRAAGERPAVTRS